MEFLNNSLPGPKPYSPRGVPHTQQAPMGANGPKSAHLRTTCRTSVLLRRSRHT